MVCLHAVVHLINLLPSPITQNIFPHALLFHTPPYYTDLKVFGCACFPFLRPYSNSKLSSNPLNVCLWAIVHLTGVTCSFILLGGFIFHLLSLLMSMSSLIQFFFPSHTLNFDAPQFTSLLTPTRILPSFHVSSSENTFRHSPSHSTHSHPSHSANSHPIPYPRLKQHLPCTLSLLPLPLLSIPLLLILLYLLSLFLNIQCK